MLSPKGDELLYAHNDQGKFKIVVRDIKSGEEKIIFRYGYKNVFQETDYNYPLLAWHPTKPEVTFAYEHRDVIKLVKYRLDSGEKWNKSSLLIFKEYSVSVIKMIWIILCQPALTASQIWYFISQKS